MIVPARRIPTLGLKLLLVGVAPNAVRVTPLVRLSILRTVIELTFAFFFRRLLYVTNVSR